MRFTDVAIRGLKSPDKGQRDYWDDGIPGFGIRVSQGGTKAFVLILNGNRRTLGRFPQITLAEARKEARKLLAQQELGRTFTGITCADALDEYVAQHVKKNNKPSSAYEAERSLRKHFSFGSKPLDRIHAQHVMRVVDALSPSAANHAFTYARAFFRWCVRRRYLDRSPLEYLPLPNPPSSRDRVLTDHELRIVWNTAQRFPFPFGTIVSLLILTGQRSGEISGLRRDYIDFDQNLITLPAEIVKNNSIHAFPFGDAASAILRPITKSAGFLFPAVTGDAFYDGHNKAKARFEDACNSALADELADDTAALQHWTLHDLRRTFSTTHARIGTPPHITEAMLNHKTGTRTPIQRIYDRHTYIPEMRAAVANYENYLRSLFHIESEKFIGPSPDRTRRLAMSRDLSRRSRIRSSAMLSEGEITSSDGGNAYANSAHSKS